MQQHAGPLSSERAEAPALPRRLLGVSLLGAAALSILPASEAQAGWVHHSYLRSRVTPGREPLPEAPGASAWPRAWDLPRLGCNATCVCACCSFKKELKKKKIPEEDYTVLGGWI